MIEYVESCDDVIGSVQQVSNVTHTDRYAAFQNASFDNAVVFSSPVTMNGPDATTVRFSEITSTSATFHLDEPEGYDQMHIAEDVSLTAFESGVWELDDGSLLQVGTTVFSGGATNEFHNV